MVVRERSVVLVTFLCVVVGGFRYFTILKVVFRFRPESWTDFCNCKLHQKETVYAINDVIRLNNLDDSSVHIYSWIIICLYNLPILVITITPKGPINRNYFRSKESEQHFSAAYGALYFLPSVQRGFNI